MTTTGFEPTTALTNWPDDWAILWVLICTLHLTVCFYHVKYEFTRLRVYSQHRSVIWPVWLNRWVLVYELSGCRFESRCIHLSIVVCHNAVLVGKWSAACSDIPIEANNHIFDISLKVKLKAIIKIRGQDHPPKFSFSLKNIFYEFVKFAFVLCKQVTKMSSFFCFWHCFI